MFNYVNEDTVKVVIDAFYKKVRSNDQLKPVFEEAIGVSDEEWAPHMQVMYTFWNAVMTKSVVYNGNPMKKHQELAPFDLSLFDVWLALFEETVRVYHTEDIADTYVEKSKMIAKSLRFAMMKDLSGV